MAEDYKKLFDSLGGLKEYLKYKFPVNGLPAVMLRDSGEIAPPHLLRCLLLAYGKQFKRARESHYVFLPDMDVLATLIEPESLQAAVRTLFSSVGFKVPNSLVFIFRYAAAKDIPGLYRTCAHSEWWVNEAANAGVLLNDSREAMMIAEKIKRLDEYAELRGADADTIRNTVLVDFGLDAEGKKRYDLGGTTIELSLQKDLSLALFDTANNKVVKSIPKKGNNEALVAAAAADFAALKKNIKKTAKSRSDKLFEDFLSGRTVPAAKWKEFFLGNALLRHIAELLVWSQDKKTWTVSGDELITSDGKEYKLTGKPISVAHPMEMQPDDVAAWQKYFVSNALKQPFEQIWEPAIAPEMIRENRYQGCMIFYRRTQNMGKHGIHFYDGDFHNDVGFRLDNCSLENEITNPYSHMIADDATFTLGKFSFSKFTRKVNHIVYLFDKWTLWEQISKDNMNVMNLLEPYNAAQVTEFIDRANEAKAVNLTAALMEYKKQHFPEYDVFSEFTLD